MANTLAHLALAQEILRRRPGLVEYTDSFFIGNIAPDSIESKAGAVRDDKKLVHLRLGITDMEWLQPEKMQIFDRRLDDFVSYFIYKETEPRQRDFCGTMRLRILRALEKQGYEDGKWPFILKVLNELEALDNYLLHSRPETAELFYRLMQQPVEHYLPGMIEKEYIEKSLVWWKEQYIPQIAGRCAEIVEMHEIDDFVSRACDTILRELESII